MELPKSLQDWTYETVLEVVRRYEYEPAHVDFKEVLHATDGSDRKRLIENIQKCAAAMANTPSGGYILFGVRDPRSGASGSVALPDELVVGIALGSDLRRELGQKLSAIQPPLQFDVHVVRLPPNSSRGVLVAAIPESPLRPHMDPSTHVFYRRGPGGNAEPMSQSEVREQMLYSNQRLQQANMLRLELHSFRLLRTALRDPNTWFARFDSQAFKILLADICDLLPRDGDLLANLHGIATMAAQLNFALEQGYLRMQRGKYIPRQLPGNPKVALDSNVQQQLTAFDAWCIRAQDALATLFGPLPITTVLWPTTSGTDELARVSEDVLNI